MDMILNALQMVLNPEALILILLGTAIGIVFGAIPGLTATMAVALCLPMTYTMNVTDSMCLLIGLYIGGISGGLISAILLRIPGTPSSLATTFDGHPMAERGEAGKALDTGVWASFFGGLLSFIVLFFLALALASVAIKFTPYDYFAVILFSLTIRVLSRHPVPVVGIHSAIANNEFYALQSSAFEPLKGIYPADL